MASSSNFDDSNAFHTSESVEETPITSQSTSEKASRKRTSDVWNIFEIQNVEGKGLRAICKKCKKDYSCSSSSGTGHLKRHMQFHESKPNDNTQATLSQYHTSGSSGLGTFSYSVERDRRELAKYLVWSEKPFSMGEDEKFRNYVHLALQPQFKSFSRNTIKSDAFTVFKEYKKTLISFLPTLSSRIALTSDIWTTFVGNASYICVTGHWIDDDWNLQKRILGFSKIDWPHTGLVISNAILQVINEYDITNKIFSISFDNATNNASAINNLKSYLKPFLNGQLFHIRCACHILNLCVHDGLKLIETHLEKIKNALRFLNGSISRKQDFKTLCTSHGLKCKNFPFDVPNRWNSTYLMLQACLPYKNVITIFFNERMAEEYHIVDNDWEIASQILNFLEPFYDATKLFSGCYYPTSSIFLNQIYEISERFASYRENVFFKTICEPMELKFKKYWKIIPLLNCLASIMDPRLKLNNVEIILDSYYSNMKFDDINVSDEKERVNSTLFSLYSLYDSAYNTRSFSIRENSSTSNNSSGKASVWTMLRKKHDTSSSSSTPSSSGELQIYLNQVIHFDEQQLENFDVLAWWKSNAKYWPVLSIMARDLLTPPVSTVPSESCFSAGGRVIDERRSRLAPKTVEMCILLKDWLDADSRLQDKVEHDVFSDENEDS